MDGSIVDGCGVLDERDDVRAGDADMFKGAVKNEGENLTIKGNVRVSKSNESLPERLSIEISNQH